MFLLRAYDLLNLSTYAQLGAPALYVGSTGSAGTLLYCRDLASHHAVPFGIDYVDVPVAEMVYPEALAQRSQAGCEALAILLRRLVVGKLNRPRINPLASFGYVYVILRHVADRPAMAVNTPPD